ncbi:hypothetical protein [Streptomyces sp. NPDC001070]
MNSAVRTGRASLLLCALAATMLATACDPGGPSASPHAVPGASRSAAHEVPREDGSGAEAVLDRAFTGREVISRGRGRPAPQLGNTLAGAPEGVLSVTFAFTCTGKSRALVDITVDGKPLPRLRGTYTCGNAVRQRSVDIPATGSVGFTADVSGSLHGEFAYAYYTERKQAPQ